MIGFGWALRDPARRAAAGDHQHRLVPAAAGQAFPARAGDGPRSAARRLADPSLQPVRARAAWFGTTRSLPKDVRGLCQRTTADQRDQHAALHAGHPAARGRPRDARGPGRRGRVARYADRPAFIAWGLQDFVFDWHFLAGFRGGAAERRGARVRRCRPLRAGRPPRVLVPAIRRFLDKHPLDKHLRCRRWL